LKKEIQKKQVQTNSSRRATESELLLKIPVAIYASPEPIENASIRASTNPRRLPKICATGYRALVPITNAGEPGCHPLYFFPGSHCDYFFEHLILGV